jgi:hypothetical protein
VASQAHAAAEVPTVVVDRPVAIGFFPPVSRQQWDMDKDGTIAQAMSDLEIALGDVKACTGLDEMRIEMHTAQSLRLGKEGKGRLLVLGDRADPAMGVVLAAPGRDPLVVSAAAAVELQDSAPRAAAQYFRAPQCARP